MTLEEWEKENDAFLIRIGQKAATPAIKPTTKKDEE
jgi:hypothetical protein